MHIHIFLITWLTTERENISYLLIRWLSKGPARYLPNPTFLQIRKLGTREIK